MLDTCPCSSGRESSTRHFSRSSPEIQSRSEQFLVVLLVMWVYNRIINRAGRVIPPPQSPARFFFRRKISTEQEPFLSSCSGSWGTSFLVSSKNIRRFQQRKSSAN